MGLLAIEWAPLDLIRGGNYAAAAASLGSGWPGIGEKPARRGMANREYALLLLACGVLSIRLGRTREGKTLAAAKDMLSESARLLSGQPEQHAAQLYLGTAYSDAGEYNEALAIADIALNTESDSEVVIGASVLKATAFKRQGFLQKAWETLESVKSLAEAVSPVFRGNYFIERGNVQRRLQNLDQAIADYDEAEECFLSAGSVLYVGVTLNNVSNVYIEQGRFSLAHNAATRAVHLFQKLGDRAFEARALDQSAKIFLAQNSPFEAEPLARRAVALLQVGDNQAWLAEALITHGRSLMSMGTDRALAQLELASKICETIGDHVQGEEASEELLNLFKNTRTLNQKFRDVLTRIEHSVIKHALKLHGNRIPPAAQSLGITRQLLLKKLSTMSDCAPTKRRRAKSLFGKRGF